MGEMALMGIKGGCEETRTGKDKDEGGARTVQHLFSELTS